MEPAVPALPHHDRGPLADRVESPVQYPRRARTTDSPVNAAVPGSGIPFSAGRPRSGPKRLPVAGSSELWWSGTGANMRRDRVPTRLPPGSRSRSDQNSGNSTLSLSWWCSRTWARPRSNQVVRVSQPGLRVEHDRTAAIRINHVHRRLARINIARNSERGVRNRKPWDQIKKA